MRLKLYRGLWAVIGRDNGKTWRRSLGTADRALAERKFRDIRVETPGELIEDAVRQYLGDKAGRRSYGSMLTAWRALKPTFGHLRPDQIDRNLCRSYAAMRRKAGISDGTVIKDLAVLRAALKFTGKAADSTFELPSAPAPSDRFITRQELQRLMDACTLEHIRLFIALAWSTAGRHGAILELTWDRVNLETGIIQLAERGQERRKGRATVKVKGLALDMLRAAHGARTSDYVIEWGGRPLKSIKRSFAEAARAAKLVDITPHVLRHSAAVAMIQAGVPLQQISQFLGHTTIKVTERVYARFSPDRFDEAADALE